MRRRIFISYGSPDKQLAKQLDDKLSPHNDIWYDDDLKKTIGQNWWDNILDEIENADVFFYLISREANESPYCKGERAEASRLGKPIFPMLVRAKADVPLDMGQLQVIDLSDGLTDDHINHILASLDNPKLYEKRTVPPRKERTPLPSQKKSINYQLWGLMVAILGIIAVLAVPFIENELNDDPTPTATIAIPTTTPQATPDIPTASPEPTTHAVIPPTNVSQPVPSGDAPLLTIQRSGDSFSLCTDQAADLSSLTFDLTNNLDYVLGEVHPASANTSAGDCWCLQKSGARFDLPLVCNDANTAQEGRSQEDWRNPVLTILDGDHVLGTCPAQEDNQSVYTCPTIELVR